MASSVTLERPRPFADDWQFKDAKDLSLSQRMLLLLGVLNPSPRHFTYPKPKGKVPVYVEYQQHARLFPIAALPVLARWILMTYMSITIPPLAMYFFMVAYLAIFMLSFVQRMKKYTLTYGFLDGEVVRDAIPESLSGKIFHELWVGLLLRPMIAVLLAYNQHAKPKLSLWLPIQLAVFTIIADFVYYWVHRATHEVDSLWHFHRRHHTTKHPVSYMLAFADEPQEIFDAIASPLIAWLAYPIDFDIMFIWTMYFVSSELFGHAGLRLYYPGPLVRSTKLTLDRSLAPTHPV